MSLDNLQTWLLNDGIESELNSLTRWTVEMEIDNLVADPHETPFETVDWQRLLLAGSILARSENRSHQEAALRIATSAVTLTTEAKVRDAGAVLLDKLSNFRAISLAERRELLAPDLETRLGVSLRLETQRREINQAVLVQSSGHWLAVNDFQERFWTNAAENDWLSASAPTASGKTFLVLQWLIDHIRSSDAKVAIYLAPTRALVSEIEDNLAQLLGAESGIEISSLPLRDKYNKARDGGPKIVMIFTQERLHLMANLLEGELKVDVLIVDEAHKIGDNQRGVILQDAIERISRFNPAAKVLFISPATQNPEELLSDAPSTLRSKSVDSDAPTVLQNVIVARQVALKPKEWHLAIRKGDAELSVGNLQLKSSPGGLRKRLAFIAAAAGERGGTLVYANGAAESEVVAELISQLIPSTDKADKELCELADLARKGVHPNFNLAPLVEQGVAFHYGNMPSLLRLEIERLFRSGKIRFLVCTSTLIEGVNLSCRTIILRGPRKGKGHPMEAHDFWNLAGRAGRWGDEFQGNIICIDPHDKKAWPTGVPRRARYPIKRESDAVLELGHGLAEYLDMRASNDKTATEDSDKFEQVGAYLLSNFLREGSIANAAFAKRHSVDIITRLETSLVALAAQIEIDAMIVARHPGVSALGLQRLLEAFRAYQGNIDNLVPAAVDSDDSYDRFISIMRRINAHLFPAFLPDGLIPLHALIVVQWLNGYSLATMIKKSIEYHKRNKRSYQLPVLIRSTMELVEQTARFRAPKYFSAYMDVLHIFLRERDRADLISEGLDIGTQLEFGVSTQTLLSLMELGLSRMSAVLLFEKIARDDLTKEDCIQWVADKNEQFDGMDLPAIIVREVRSKLVLAAASPNTLNS